MCDVIRRWWEGGRRKEVGMQSKTRTHTSESGGNNTEGALKATLAVQANLGEIKTSNLQKMHPNWAPQFHPKWSKNPSIGDVGSHFTFKVVFQTIFGLILMVF